MLNIVYIRILTLIILNPYNGVHVSVTKPVLLINHITRDLVISILFFFVEYNDSSVVKIMYVPTTM